jgi:hypothetical protein
MRFKPGVACYSAAGRHSKVVFVDGAEIRKAAEVELLTPDERQRLLNERVVTDLSTISPEFLARVRQKGRALLESRGVVGSDQP